jgi:hypothetical protein
MTMKHSRPGPTVKHLARSHEIPNRYGHVLEQRQRAVAREMDAVLGGR